MYKTGPAPNPSTGLEEGEFTEVPPLSEDHWKRCVSFIRAVVANCTPDTVACDEHTQSSVKLCCSQEAQTQACVGMKGTVKVPGADGSNEPLD